MLPKAPSNRDRTSDLEMWEESNQLQSHALPTELSKDTDDATHDLSIVFEETRCPCHAADVVLVLFSNLGNHGIMSCHIYQPR